MIAHSRVEFLGATGGGFNPSAFGTPVGYWDADDGDWVGAATNNVSKVPSRYLGGPDLIATGTGIRSVSGWAGAIGGSQLGLLKGSGQGYYYTVANNNYVVAAEVVNLDSLNDLQAVMTLRALSGYGLWWYNSLYGPQNVMEVYASGNGGYLMPQFTPGLHVIMIRAESGNVYGYLDGVLIYTWLSPPSAYLPMIGVSFGNRPGYSAGGQLRACVAYSNLTSTPADLSAALAAYYL